MNAFTVFKVCQEGSRQLLLVQPINDSQFSLAVYDEHTGQTLLRMTDCTVSELKRAISMLESDE